MTGDGNGIQQEHTLHLSPRGSCEWSGISRAVQGHRQGSCERWMLADESLAGKRLGGGASGESGEGCGASGEWWVVGGEI